MSGLQRREDGLLLQLSSAEIAQIEALAARLGLNGLTDDSVGAVIGRPVRIAVLDASLLARQFWLMLTVLAPSWDLVAALAAEGGLPAVFWAGPQRSREPTRLRLGFAGQTLSYAIELGYRVDDQTSAFALDPEIKREWIWAGGPFHPRSLLVHRQGAVVERCGGGSMRLAVEVSPQESLFTAVSDPLEAPEVFRL
ncbi:MAG: hypothetical protein EBR33_02900, partial [Synechococcaceae bacterium WB4_1_0192]|nr:hypothetical protein [Synechococcaceae bacterium WB4_1_0192]